MAKRLDLAKEVQFERQNSDLEWEIIGDSSPLKHGDTVQVVIGNSTGPVNVANLSHGVRMINSYDFILTPCPSHMIHL